MNLSGAAGVGCCGLCLEFGLLGVVKVERGCCKRGVLIQ